MDSLDICPDGLSVLGYPKGGRPGISNEQWNQIVDMARAGIPVKAVVEATGVCKTTVYQIYAVKAKKPSGEEAI